jgi:N-acetyl-alpha-D-glucosaminyl L-malate synthase BshA
MKPDRSSDSASSTNGNGPQRRFRIGVSCYPTIGGSGTVAVELASALAARGHLVHVVSYESPVRLRPSRGLFFHEVDVSDYPLFKYPPYVMALSSRLSDVAIRHKLDILHAHYAVPHSVSAFLAREIVGGDRPRIVTTLHGTDITLIGTDPAYRPITRFALEKSDVVTAPSAWLKEQTERDIGGCMVKVIPNFVDVRRFHPGLRSAAGRFCGSDEWMLVHVSNFRPVKRIADVVRIFARVSERHPARLVMIGDGPERPVAEREAAALGVSDRVMMLGNVTDVETVVACSDAMLLPSAGESFGLAALEAMACGVLVVGARAGGLPEVVTDGQDGILEEVGDVGKMAARLFDVLSVPAKAQAFSRAAREAAESRYRTELIVPMYEAAYEAALARPIRRS